MDSNSSLPRARSSVSQSAPTFALLSEIGESLDIDVNTGLPKLPVELPDFFTDSTEEGQPRKSVSFHPVLETDLSMSRNVSVFVRGHEVAIAMHGCLCLLLNTHTHHTQCIKASKL